LFVGFFASPSLDKEIIIADLKQEENHLVLKQRLNTWENRITIFGALHQFSR